MKICGPLLLWFVHKQNSKKGLENKKKKNVIQIQGENSVLNCANQISYG